MIRVSQLSGGVVMEKQRIIVQRSRDLGGGFVVGRVLPVARQRMVGPFIFFDHLGPLELAPGIPRSLDIRPHPHIGLSTVTYLYKGAFTHRDSLGIEQEMRRGEVNWLTAGSGITHSERLEYARQNGANMHGIQAWVALPKANEEDDPEFQHYHDEAQLTEWSDAGVTGRLIADEHAGLGASVKTHSPLFYVHLTMNTGSRYALPAEYSERAIYVAEGEIEVNGHPLQQGQMLVLQDQNTAVLHALKSSIVMLLGGEPVGERFIFWNFVSSSQERIEQAKADWQAQRMKLPIGDDQEFIPLP